MPEVLPSAPSPLVAFLLPLQIDARYIRPDEYREYWQEVEDRRRAQQLEKLMTGQPDTLLEHFISHSSRKLMPSKTEESAGSSSSDSSSTKLASTTDEPPVPKGSSSSTITGTKGSSSSAAGPAGGSSSGGVASLGQAQQAVSDTAAGVDKPRRAWWRLW
jgi:hypothetical protein